MLNSVNRHFYGIICSLILNFCNPLFGFCQHKPSYLPCFHKEMINVSLQFSAIVDIDFVTDSTIVIAANYNKLYYVDLQSGEVFNTDSVDFEINTISFLKNGIIVICGNNEVIIVSAIKI